MGKSTLACLGFLPIILALSVPLPSVLFPSPLNGAIDVPTNLSTSNNLSRPLAPGILALDLYDVLWHSGDSIQSTSAPHLLYNIFIAVLRCWRDPSDVPFLETTVMFTQRYRNIDIVIVPGAARVADRFTSNIAGALIWRMLLKCLEPEPTYWAASLITRGEAPRTVGLVRTEAHIGSLGAASESDLGSKNASAAKVSTKWNQHSNITLGNTISEQIHFRGPMGVENARDSWLKAFLLVSAPILTRRSSLAEVTIVAAPDIICESKFHTTGSFDIVFQSKAGNRPPGSTTALTYDELFRGIQDVLETVVATKQYQLLDAEIFKDGWMAATFRVFAKPHPGSSRSNVAVA